MTFTNNVLAQATVAQFYGWLNEDQSLKRKKLRPVLTEGFRLSEPSFCCNFYVVDYLSEHFFLIRENRSTVSARQGKWRDERVLGLSMETTCLILYALQEPGGRSRV